jgi:hypothetical protein
MGMFDWVNFACDCPNCGSPVGGFQTKDGDCLLEWVDTPKIENYYSNCEVCDYWIEYNNGVLNLVHPHNNEKELL